MVLLAGLSACGFQLRTYGFSAAVDSYTISGDSYANIAADIRRGLNQAGLTEKPSGEGTLNLELLDHERQRRAVSTSQSALVAEYETRLSVTYRILGVDGKELAPAVEIDRRRVYRVDRVNIVGNSEEQALLERELQQDIVGQIIRAMDSVGRMLASSNAG